MVGLASASNRTARFCLLGVATVSAVLLITTDQADARRYRHHRRHVERSAYSPAFASIIVDGNSGGTLQATNPDSLRHPASLTKIMTLYMLFERLESGKIKLDSAMDVSEHASEQAPTKLGLRPGQSIRVEDAIKGLVTRSANDAAVVIAEAIAGDEDEFAKAMTRKARALGMSKTVYKNASGLPDDDQVTTARDQATLGRAIQDRFPKYYRYFATDAFNFRGRVIRNHNRLIGRVEGVDGIKTGYTRASGFNLVTSLKRGNRFLVGVVLGGRSGGSRDAIMRNLLAEHLEEGATRRTVAAITERGMDVRVATAARADDDDETPVRAQPSEAPTVQVQGAIQTAAAISEPVPPPAPRAPSVTQAAMPSQPAQQKPAPAPLTSGFVSQPLSLMPGSAEPMTPVRVKTVQVRVGATKVASAGSSAPAPMATSAIPTSRTEPAETSKGMIAKAEIPPAQPTPSSATATAPSTAMAYADPSRGMPPTTLADQARALEGPAEAPAKTVAQPVTPPQPQTIQQNGAVKVAPVRSGWIIQVGALETESEARQRLDTAKGSARGLLGRADPFTEAVVSKGDKTLYRARFAGLDKDSAEAACRTLKRSDISCIAIRN